MTSPTTTSSDFLIQADSGCRSGGRAFKSAAAAKSASCACLIPNIDELLAAVVRAQRLKLITIKAVTERTGMGDSFIHAEIAAGRFPKPVKLGASKSRRAAARFVDGEVSDWIERHIAERDLPPSMSGSIREAA